MLPVGITLNGSLSRISEPATLEQDDSWIKVNPKQTVPFTFGGRGKVRHRDTHKVRVHQIAVKVDMWAPTAPVSVDKVGVYFRQTSAEANVRSIRTAGCIRLLCLEKKVFGKECGKKILCFPQIALPPARLVFEITLEGSARKLVTVRSALVIKNSLTETVEAKLENPVSYPDGRLLVLTLRKGVRKSCKRVGF